MKNDLIALVEEKISEMELHIKKLDQEGKEHTIMAHKAFTDEHHLILKKREIEKQLVHLCKHYPLGP